MKHLFNYLIALLVCIITISNAYSQEDYKTKGINRSLNSYKSDNFYTVEKFTEPENTHKPKNIILLIGDGMGISHIYSGITANGGNLYMQTFRNIGFCKTFSATDYVTDSAASGTAIATGTKTYNGAIGVNTDKQPIENIREWSEKRGMATGVVSTSAVTHATPAAFVAHVTKRTDYEGIAEDFTESNIDVFIGGGYDHFAKRKDGKDLLKVLKDKGYTVADNIADTENIRKGKLACLTAPKHNPKVTERGDLLPRASVKAIDILSKSTNGFFLMIEGSQIDWGGHQNDLPYIVTELLDFDKTVGEVLKFAANDKETLVIVTADHETGGLAITGGDIDKGKVEGKFTTTHHSGLVVPIMAFGPGADQFRGFMDNTDISKKIKTLLIGNISLPTDKQQQK